LIPAFLHACKRLCPEITSYAPLSSGRTTSGDIEHHGTFVIAMVNTDDKLVVQSFHFRSSLVVLHNGLIEPLVSRQHHFPEIPAVDARDG